MSIVVIDGLPYWFLDARETGKIWECEQSSKAVSPPVLNNAVSKYSFDLNPLHYCTKCAILTLWLSLFSREFGNCPC